LHVVLLTLTLDEELCHLDHPENIGGKHVLDIRLRNVAYALQASDKPSIVD
jgi:hypothetical protein